VLRHQSSPEPRSIPRQTTERHQEARFPFSAASTALRLALAGRGVRRLRGLMKQWDVITEASWRKAAGVPVVAAATSAPGKHLRIARRLATSFARSGVMEDVTFILFTHGGRDRLTLLDGNHRALALQLTGDAASLRRARFRVIVGTSTSPCLFHGEDQRWVRRPLAGRPPGRYILDIWTP
jgi:hypothetical protein